MTNSIFELKKWECPKCKLEWFTGRHHIYFICPRCNVICNSIKNEWHIMGRYN
jgi:hypothetical protein